MLNQNHIILNKITPVVMSWYFSETFSRKTNVLNPTRYQFSMRLLSFRFDWSVVGILCASGIGGLQLGSKGLWD